MNGHRISNLNWGPVGNSTSQLGTQNECKCRIFIVRLKNYMQCAYNPKPSNDIP